LRKAQVDALCISANGLPLSVQFVGRTSPRRPCFRENFFSKMTRQRIRRGVFRSIADK
jgi:hypothetical protein